MISPVRYSAISQLTVVILTSATLWLVDAVVAYSYALGSIVYLIPNLYFVHYAFRYSGAENAFLVARSFGWGESGKLALSAVGFVLLYRLVSPLNHVAVFAGFTSMIILQWVIAARIVKARAKHQQV